MVMGGAGGGLTVSVVVLTRNRPSELSMCLEALKGLTVRPLEVIVVDDSDGDPNAELRRTWSAVRWMSGRPSRHRINGLRTLGGQAARGEVVAYLDDDSIVQPQWLEALVSAYGAEDVCGAGGRVIENGGSRTSGGEVGRLGALLEPVGNFHLNGEAVREVDHLRGCNFSFRRRCLEEVGWFHDGYHGWCLRDDTDICLTLREGGHRLVFEPRAVVRHLAGEQGTSSRNTYSLRWAYVGARWHSYFVVRHGGRQFGSRWRYLVIEPLVEPLRILRQEIGRAHV